MALLLQKTTDTPIKPKDIDTDDFWEGTFADRDAEWAAFWVVRFCQSRRSWAPFQLIQLYKYLEFTALPTDMSEVSEGELNSLLNLLNGDLVQFKGEVITLTVAFVATCYKTAPVLGLPRKRVKRISRRVPKVSKYELITTGDPFKP